MRQPTCSRKGWLLGAPAELIDSFRDKLQLQGKPLGTAGTAMLGPEDPQELSEVRFPIHPHCVAPLGHCMAFPWLVA